MDLAGVPAGAHFGAAVALSNNGNAAVVGAPAADSGNGAVYPFGYFGLSSAYWIDGNEIASPAGGAAFGTSVAISFTGGYDFVGAPGVGDAYEYTSSGLQRDVFADPEGPGGSFGASIAVAGMTMDQLVVGAPGDDAAYDFDGSHGADWTADGAALGGGGPGDDYGTAVAVSSDGGTALVGAPGADAAVHLIAGSFTAPGAPTAVQALAGAESATVSWSAPALTGGSPITGYTVTATPGGLTCHTDGSTSCTVTGLEDGLPYTFTVVASNTSGAGAASGASAAVTPQAPASQAPPVAGDPLVPAPSPSPVSPSGGAPAPSAPAVLLAPAGPLRASGLRRGAVTLRWGAGSGAFVVYRQFPGRAWRALGVTTAHTLRAGGLRRGQRVRFAVRAAGADGAVSAPLVGRWLTAV